MENVPGWNVGNTGRGQWNKIELTEMVSLGGLLRPFHLPTFLYLGWQRVAPLAQQAQRMAAVTIHERVC